MSIFDNIKGQPRDHKIIGVIDGYDCVHSKHVLFSSGDEIYHEKEFGHMGILRRWRWTKSSGLRWSVLNKVDGKSGDFDLIRDHIVKYYGFDIKNL